MSSCRVLLSFFIALVVCSVGSVESFAQSADEKALAAYRLDMATVRKVAAAAQAFAAEEAKSPKVQERAKIQAEIKTLEEKDELTDAESQRLEKLYERAEALEQEIDADDGDSNETLAQIEARIRKEPRAMAILTREGLTPREFTLCTMALLQASMIEGFSRGKADLTKLPAGVNPENVRFVRENKAELEKLQKMMTGKK